MGSRRFWVALLLAAAALGATQGPSKGTLIIVGGGTVGPEILNRFIELAGGKDAPIVYIPTAADGEPGWMPRALFSRAPE